MHKLKYTPMLNNPFLGMFCKATHIAPSFLFSLTYLFGLFLNSCLLTATRQAYGNIW